VIAGQMNMVDFHFKSHWEQHRVEGDAMVRSCSGLRQLEFRDAQHGLRGGCLFV
jgi:hypothetical protein